MSLVANYTDSEEEDEDDKGDVEEKNTINSTESNEHLNDYFGGGGKTNEEHVAGCISKNKSLNLFGVIDGNGAAEDSSNSDTDDDDLHTDESKGQKKHRPLEKPLDNPFRYFGSGNVSAKDSVLRVEFREQEAHKTAVLERHVKMTETAGAALTINGKKICWNHRKGKCRFGHNCKFAHDSDILSTETDGMLKHPDKSFEPIVSANEVPVLSRKRNPVSNNSDDSDVPTTVVFASSAHLTGENNLPTKKKKSSDDLSDDELEDVNKTQGRNKKRPGLSSTLVPGKKTMKMYYKAKSS